MSKRLIVAEFGDIHGGCRYGLMRPGIQLPPPDDYGKDWTPELTETQKWIYEKWLEHLVALDELADGDEIFPIVGGDVTHGDKHEDKEKVSVRRYDHILIAADILGQVARHPNVKRMRILKGTASHVFGHGTAELAVAELLQLRHNIEVDVAYHYRLKIRDVIFDVFHQGAGAGIRRWTKGNVFQLYVQDIVFNELLAHKTPPHVVVRHHYHQFVPRTYEIDVNGDVYKTVARICPSYCGIEDWTRSATQGRAHKLTVGMLAFEIVNRQLRDDFHFTSTLDLRKTEVIE